MTTLDLAVRRIAIERDRVRCLDHSRLIAQRRYYAAEYLARRAELQLQIAIADWEQLQQEGAA